MQLAKLRYFLEVELPLASRSADVAVDGGNVSSAMWVESDFGKLVPIKYIHTRLDLKKDKNLHSEARSQWSFAEVHRRNHAACETPNATSLLMRIKRFYGYKPIFCSASISIMVSGNQFWANCSFKEQSIVLENSGTLWHNVFEQISSLSCCSSAAHSLSCVMWQHRWIIWPWEQGGGWGGGDCGGNLKWLLNSDDRESEAKQKSLSFSRLHKNFRWCQSRANKLRPPQAFSLQKKGATISLAEASVCMCACSNSL